MDVIMTQVHSEMSFAVAMDSWIPTLYQYMKPCNVTKDSSRYLSNKCPAVKVYGWLIFFFAQGQNNRIAWAQWLHQLLSWNSCWLKIQLTRSVPWTMQLILVMIFCSTDTRKKNLKSMTSASFVSSWNSCWVKIQLTRSVSSPTVMKSIVQLSVFSAHYVTNHRKLVAH